VTGYLRKRKYGSASRDAARLLVPRERRWAVSCIARSGESMPQRMTEVLGKAVVSADGGERLGTVSDVLLDDRDHHFVGLIVRRGMMKTEHVLPSAAIQTFGRDAVVSRTTSDLMTAKEWHQRTADVSGRSSEPGSL
jgi:sporulation protein YlmC with PRC-barrel domain